jgi:hypothetical protein
MRPSAVDWIAAPSRTALQENVLAGRGSLEKAELPCILALARLEKWNA